MLSESRLGNFLLSTFIKISNSCTKFWSQSVEQSIQDALSCTTLSFLTMENFIANFLIKLSFDIETLQSTVGIFLCCLTEEKYQIFTCRVVHCSEDFFPFFVKSLEEVLLFQQQHNALQEQSIFPVKVSLLCLLLSEIFERENRKLNYFHNIPLHLKGKSSKQTKPSSVGRQ